MKTISENPYSFWWSEFLACKTEAEKLVLYRLAFDGEFGSQVKHSLFGIGPFMPELIDAGTLHNMKFYAAMEN
jgi:hypothetical protein